MKKKLKCFIALIIAALALFQFAACTKDPSADKTEPIIDGKIVLAYNGKTNYTIVYPADASDAVVDAASKLQASLKEHTGIEIAICAESGDGSLSTDKEILLGKTLQVKNSALYDDVLDPMGYSIFTAENKLVIYSEKDEELGNIVDIFISEILAKSETDPKELFALGKENSLYKKRYGVLASAKINGVELDKFQIVYPQKGYAEKYMADLFHEYLTEKYARAVPKLVSDEAPESEYEILIGNTNRTTGITSDTGKANITVKGTKLIVTSSDLTAFPDLFPTLRNMFPATGGDRVEISADNVTVKTLDTFVKSESADIKVMFHNILGYLVEYPAANRPELTLSLYLEHTPDVIGMQEMGEKYYRAYASKLTKGLKSEGYEEIVFKSDGGTGNPIFYNKNKLDLLDSGYGRARNSDKGSTYAIFKVKENGKTFAVINSHFSANSNANNDATLGNTYRVEDAKIMLKQAERIKTKYPDIPILSGGDFNGNKNSDPYKTITGAGLKDAIAVAKIAPTVTPKLAYPTYNKDYERYNARLAETHSITNAIDCVVLGGAIEGIDVLEYAFLNDKLSCMVSDHSPHMILFNWK